MLPERRCPPDPLLESVAAPQTSLHLGGVAASQTLSPGWQGGRPRDRPGGPVAARPTRARVLEGGEPSKVQGGQRGEPPG